MSPMEADEKNRPLLRIAGVLAYLLHREPGIKAIGLTGSIARREPANDVDLIVTHTLAEDLVFVAHLNRKKKGKPFIDGPKQLWEVLPIPLERSLLHVCLLADVAADLFFVHEKILTECEYLEKMPVPEQFKDFYRRVFCEIPSMSYVPERHGFDARVPVCHKDRSCCQPVMSWAAVQEERKKLREEEEAAKKAAAPAPVPPRSFSESGYGS